MDQKYTLIGVINFKSPMVQTRTSADSNIGHYTAISYRKNKKWFQYDDCKDAQQVLHDNYSICPHIIIYSL